MIMDPWLSIFSFVRYMPESDFSDGKHERIRDEIDEAIMNIAEKYGLDIELCRGIDTLLSDNPKDTVPRRGYSNHNRCVECGGWTSAHNQGEPILLLKPGAEYNGEIYCKDHLPVESPMYHELQYT